MEEKKDFAKRQISEKVKKYPEVNSKIVAFTRGFSLVEEKSTEILLRMCEILTSFNCSFDKKEMIDYMSSIGLKISSKRDCT